MYSLVQSQVVLSMTTTNSTIPSVSEFADIAPYSADEFHDKIAALVKEPGFEHAVRYIIPGVDYPAFAKQIASAKSQKEFQEHIMGDFLTMLEHRSTDGISASGIENVEPGKSYTFISNHRDIVLDASFLNLVFLRHNLPVTQIAIGNNLLITDWITDLVKINRSFIVKRNVRKLEALSAARQLSGYIHYTIDNSHESVWIAQREGRAKDSNDRTQESLIKMLSFAGGGDTKENLEALNLMPVAISYEYDPNDYLKVREFLLKKRDPEYKKSERDDLFSMETGLVGYKGRVHFHVGKCINEDLETCPCEQRGEAVQETCKLIDRSIHRGYYLYPINYIAYDRLENSTRFADKYSADDLTRVNDYLSNQLAKVEVDSVTDEEAHFMEHTMLAMYANPVRNQLDASK